MRPNFWDLLFHARRSYCDEGMALGDDNTTTTTCTISSNFNTSWSTPTYHQPGAAAISYKWDPMGFIDVTLPGIFIFIMVGYLYRTLERSYVKSPGKTTYLSFIGTISRLSLPFLLFAPYPLVRTRWDWFLATPNIFEVFAHLYHFHDTGAHFKKAFFGHHCSALFIMWPLSRLLENSPYPLECLSIAVMFEGASAWSYAHYLFHRYIHDLARATGLTKQEDLLLACLEYMCFMGQRLMRWYALWCSFTFAISSYHSYPYFLYCLSIPSLFFELYGFSRQYPALPHFPSEKITKLIRAY